MATATLAHTLLAAHRDRVRELSTLYGALERVAVKEGGESDAGEAAHRALAEAIRGWSRVDREVERRDLVTLTSAESAALGAQITRAARHGDPTVRAELERAGAGLRELSRATRARVERSLGRLARLEALAGPTFILLEEVLLLGRLLAPDGEASDLAPFDPERGFERTFLAAIDATLVRPPGAEHAVDLGLGAAIARLLPRGRDPLALEETWRAKMASDHPFARAPFVPRGRFASCAPRDVARCDLEGTGPIGWADGDDVTLLAAELRAFEQNGAELALKDMALKDMAQRLVDAAGEGHALVGLIEVLPPEAEGHRLFVGEA